MVLDQWIVINTRASSLLAASSLNVAGKRSVTVSLGVREPIHRNTVQDPLKPANSDLEASR